MSKQLWRQGLKVVNENIVATAGCQTAGCQWALRLKGETSHSDAVKESRRHAADKNHTVRLHLERFVDYTPLN